MADFLVALYIDVIMRRLGAVFEMLATDFLDEIFFALGVVESRSC